MRGFRPMRRGPWRGPWPRRHGHGLPLFRRRWWRRPRFGCCSLMLALPLLILVGIVLLGVLR